MFVIRLSGDARMPNTLLRGPNAEQFIATGCSHRIKNRLAAAAAIHFPARCHHWQRPLPIMSPPAANRKSMAFFPLGQCARPNLPTPLSLLSCAYQSAIPTFLISSALFCGMITLYTSHRSYLRRSPRLCKGWGSGCALFLHYCYHTASFSSGLNNVAMKPYVVFFCP